MKVRDARLCCFMLELFCERGYVKDDVSLHPVGLSEVAIQNDIQEYLEKDRENTKHLVLLFALEWSCLWVLHRHLWFKLTIFLVQSRELSINIFLVTPFLFPGLSVLQRIALVATVDPRLTLALAGLLTGYALMHLYLSNPSRHKEP